MEVLPYVVRYLVNGIGFAGAVFVAYGVAVGMVGIRAWQFAERYGPRLAGFLTIFGTLLTAASIFEPFGRPSAPEILSKVVTAPILIVGCIIAAIAACRRELSPWILNGLALLGLAGALLRILPNPYMPY